MSKIVSVIGGEGFIGKKLVQLLLEKNFKVRVLDIKNVNKKYLNYDYFKVDVLELESLKKILKNSSYVFNFAGFSDLNKATRILEIVQNNEIEKSKARQKYINYKKSDYQIRSHNI